ncbi:MAG: VWA domain-containing protein [Pseudomonadales bacterium]|nr:VWA domain-containing protein [Pseudomonadales bacterium]
MARKKKSAFDPISLAFLDVMSCGFGAVILIFLILDHTATERTDENEPTVTAEVELLEEEILQGEENLVQIRNTLAEISLEVVTTQGLANRVQQEIDDFRQQLAELEGVSLGSEESIERLRADIKSLEEDLLRLQSSAVEQTGSDARAFVGEGDRQYLTGMFLGGNRILVLLDMSSSMLDETLVNILRIRNMPDGNKRQARKWQQAVKTVDWISSQLPVASQYQIYAFNDEVRAVIPGTEGEWLEVADKDGLDQAINNVGQLVPANGTNLEKVFQSVSDLNPRPDNIYLITDGLPTLSSERRQARLITPGDRLDLFGKAVEYLPVNIPVNIILLPLEGDPSAAAAYWILAQRSRGSFLSPSRDWP